MTEKVPASALALCLVLSTSPRVHLTEHSLGPGRLRSAWGKVVYKAPAMEKADPVRLLIDWKKLTWPNMFLNVLLQGQNVAMKFRAEQRSCFPYLTCCM